MMASRTVVLREQKEKLVILVASVFITLTLLALYLPEGIDWSTTYRPATRALLSGESPYEAVETFFNAPWTLVPLLPLAVLPVAVGRAILFSVSVMAFGYVSYKFGAKPVTLGAFLCSPPIVHSLLNSNVDWMPIIGFILPPQIGLFFVVIKPQLGIVVVFFWLIESWRHGGLREVVRVFWPISVAMITSLILFGFWPLRWNSLIEITRDQGYNISVWPISLPVGLVLIVTALRTREIRYAFPAAPCFSPYVLLHVWSGALVALAPYTFEMVAAVVGLWGLVAIRIFAG